MTNVEELQEQVRKLWPNTHVVEWLTVAAYAWQMLIQILRVALALTFVLSSYRFEKTRDSYEAFVAVISILILLYLKGESK